MCSNRAATGASNSPLHEVGCMGDMWTWIDGIFRDTEGDLQIETIY